MKIKLGLRSVRVPDGFEKLGSDKDDKKKDDGVYIFKQTESALCMVRLTQLKEKEAMPFKQAKVIIDGIHEALGEKQGLIAVRPIVNKSGDGYAYSIVKSALEEHGMQYILTMHSKIKDKYFHLQGWFEESGTTGMRDAIIYAMAEKEGKVGRNFEGWFKDPYDPEYKHGLPMNLSEREEYDKMFPNHPLSECRRFVAEVIESNIK